MFRRSLLIVSLSLLALAAPARGGRNCAPAANVKVECSSASAFINLRIDHCRRIGKVVIEVKDASGKVLYREVGKALSNVLVRRLDKGVFPSGDLTLSVSTRDFSIAQVFTVK